MGLFRASLVAASVVSAGLLLPACRAEGPRSLAYVYKEQHLRLRSGLRVVIVPDLSATLVQVDVRYEVGSREDPPGQAGLAHLVEHLTFEVRPGGPERPALVEHSKQAASYFNAYTTWDSTHYASQGRPEMLEWLLKIEAVRLTHGCEAITQLDFLREREVVRNEVRQRLADEMAVLLPAVLEAAYPSGHAYSRPIIGNDVELASVTLQDVCRFFHDHYVPGRATLIIAGNVDVAQTEATVMKWFGQIPGRPGAPRRAVAPVPTAGRELARDSDIAQPALAVAWSLPSASSPAGQAARAELGRVADKVQSLLFTRHLSTWISSATVGGNDAPLFALLIGLEKGEYADRVLELVRRAAADTRIEVHAIARTLKGSREQDWLDENRGRLKAHFVQSVEPLHARTEIIGDMVQFEVGVPFLSGRAFLAHGLGKIDSLDTPQLAEAARRIVRVENATVILFRATGGRSGEREAAFRFQTRSHGREVEGAIDPREASKPLEVPARLGTFATVERYTLGNGLRVVLARTDGMPVAASRLVIDAGDAHSGRLAGLAEVTANMLLPPRQDPLEGTGMGVDCESGADRTVCATAGINVYLDLMLEGLERYVVGGRYHPEVFRNGQRHRRNWLRRPTRRLRLAVERQFLAALFGADHRYAAGPLLDDASSERITMEAVRDFHDRHYTARNAALIVAGNFDVAQAKDLVRETFGDWNSGGATRRVPPAQRQRTAPEHIGVVGLAGPQARILLGFPAPAGVDDQEAARRVLTEMLSQRVGRIRTRLGAAYTASAGRVPRVGPSAYTARADVDPARAGEALKAIRDELAAMRRGTGLGADFVRARRKIVSDLLAESTVSTELAARLGFIASFGLADDFYDTLLRRAATVSHAEIDALIRHELRPEREVIVMLAEQPVLAAAFASAGIAAPRYVSATASR